MMQKIHEVAPSALGAARRRRSLRFLEGLVGARGVGLNHCRCRDEFTERLVTGGKTPQQVIRGELISQS